MQGGIVRGHNRWWDLGVGVKEVCVGGGRIQNQYEYRMSFVKLVCCTATKYSHVYIITSRRIFFSFLRHLFF